MMLTKPHLPTLILPLLAQITRTLACPEHDYHPTSARSLERRAETGNVTWTYEQSVNWGYLSPDFHLCQDGTQQSPIPLLLTQGLSLSHQISFDYPTGTTDGTFINWGYGPAMTLAHAEGDYSTLPSFTFEEDGEIETVYMTGWHIHSPGDHTVQGDRSKLEMHYVHVNSTGSPRAVLAIRVDPGNADSPFFAQMPSLISYRSPGVTTPVSIDLSLALDEVNNFNEFWTYQGSLTSPPCTEGIRFYVARNILFTGVQQMQDILRVSHYSARAEQEVWRHQINV